jgi:hypothetical protein
VDLAGELTTNLITVLSDIFTQALRCEAPALITSIVVALVSSILVVIDSTSTGMRSFLARWRWVVGSLALLLALLIVTGRALGWRRSVVRCLSLLLLRLIGVASRRLARWRSRGRWRERFTCVAVLVGCLAWRWLIEGW